MGAKESIAFPNPDVRNLSLSGSGDWETEIQRRVVFVIHSRANWARCRTVIESTKRPHVVVCSSALIDAYGDVSREIPLRVTKIHTQVDPRDITSMAKTAGLATVELATYFASVKPDIVVTVADRYETISTAIAAKYMGITLAHIQGGEVTGSIDEYVRHAITKLSDYHFVCTERAESFVTRMGEDPERVFNYGCPSLDLASACRGRRLPPLGDVGVGDFDPDKPFILGMMHSVTNMVTDTLTKIRAIFKALSDLEPLTQVVWLWPNVDFGTDLIVRELNRINEATPFDVKFLKHLPAEDFYALMSNCEFMVGNSSSGVREGGLLGVPYVLVGDRQKGREYGDNVDANGHIPLGDRFRHALNWRPEPTDLYGDGSSGQLIAEALEVLPLINGKVLSYVKE